MKKLLKELKNVLASDNFTTIDIETIVDKIIVMYSPITIDVDSINDINKLILDQEVLIDILDFINLNKFYKTDTIKNQQRFLMSLIEDYDHAIIENFSKFSRSEKKQFVNRNKKISTVLNYVNGVGGQVTVEQMLNEMSLDRIIIERYLRFLSNIELLNFDGFIAEPNDEYNEKSLVYEKK